MLNKPNFHLIKNTRYAINGLFDILSHETSFKIEIFLSIMISLVLILFDFGFLYISKAIIFLSMFIPIIAEVINSAIERVVDLVTLEYHDMAKRAKDMGSLIVFMSFVFMICIWGVVVYYELVIR